MPGIATSADFLPVLERLAQGFAVHELHFRSERDALREPGDGHAGEAAVDEAPDERARGFRFNGGAEGEHDFTHLPFFQTLGEPIDRSRAASTRCSSNSAKRAKTVRATKGRPSVVWAMSMETNPSGSFTLMKKMSSEIPMTISGETVRTYREACRSWRPGNSVRLRHSAASTPSSVASEAARAATESVFTTASISAALPKSWLYHLSVNPFHADVYLAALKEYAIDRPPTCRF